MIAKNKSIHYIYIIFIYIIACIQQVYSRYSDTVKDAEYVKDYTYIYINETLTKHEVLQLKGLDNHSYICRNDICVFINSFYYEPYIEFPDENGNINKYILRTITPEYIPMNISSYKLPTADDYVYFKCNTDSECLSKKCLNYACIFNERISLTGCNSYTPPRSFFRSRRTYMHCGKLEGSHCTTDDECSWNHCGEFKNVSRCSQIGFPAFSSKNDKKGGYSVYLAIGIFIAMCIIILIIICYYCSRLSKYIQLNKHL